MNRAGRLLIAHPNLPKNEWFHKKVIYIYAEKKNEGTVGICTNFPTTYSVTKLLGQKGLMFGDTSQVVYSGGPVNRNQVILFHSNEFRSVNTVDVGNGYAISSDQLMFERMCMGETPAYYRVIAGVCGWQPGQLDMELDGSFPYKSENSWLTAQPNDDILFNYKGEEQWNQALKLSSQQMIDSYF